jgi:anti-sigma factor RsiW
MTQRDTFEELELLLPFYVNGTLGADDRLKVEQALASAPHLRASLGQQVQLSQRLKVEGETWLEPCESLDDQLSVIWARIDDLAIPPAPHKPKEKVTPQRKSFSELLSFLSPNHWHPAVSLALAVAVLAQGAFLIGWATNRTAQGTTVASLQKRVHELEFQLASGPDGPTALGNIIVQLDERALWSDVEVLLKAQGLSIVGGPNDGTLTLSTPAQGDALDDTIVKLRASPLVASADKAA